MEKSAPTIVISGLHRGESPQPGGAVVQSIRAHLPKARFIGISYDPLETGLYSEGDDRLDAAYLFPFPGAGPQNLLSRLREIHQEDPIDLVIPTLDSEQENYFLIQNDLDEMGIKVILPERTSLAARQKVELAQLGLTAKVSVPRTYSANTKAQLAEKALLIGYPCYVKGPLYEARLVSNEWQLYQAFSSIFDVWGGPILVQEAVYGEEYNIAAVGDGKGGVVGSVAIRKLLRSKMGKGFGGITVSDPKVTEITNRLFKALKWRGPLEIELVKPLEKPHYLFEINPRFPAWISFAAQIDVNLPAWIVADILDLQLPELKTPAPGKMFLRHCVDIVADIAQIADLSIDLQTSKTDLPRR